MEEKTEDTKPVEVYKLPARKSTPSKSWALQQGVNVLSGVQKGFRLFQGVPKGLIKGIQKGFHAGSESSPVKPSPCTAVAQEISEIIGLKWKGFLVKRATNITEHGIFQEWSIVRCRKKSVVRLQLPDFSS